MSAYKWLRLPILVTVVASLVFVSCSPATTAPAATQAPPIEAPVQEEEAAPTEAPAPTSLPTEAPEPTAILPTGEVVIASGVDAGTLDPLRMTTVMPETNALMHVFDTLVRRDDNMEFQPWLAESWELLDDLTWQFNLRDDVTFHNGEPFNAAAVEYTFQRALDPETKATYPWLAYVFLDKVEVVDDYTVKLITTAPAPSMLFALAEFAIQPPGYYSENSLEAVSSNPVGSGPYKFVEWVKNDHITLEANLDYWQGPPAIETVVFRIIPEVGTSLAELKAGGVDIAPNVPPDLAESVETDTTRLEGIQSDQSMVIGLHITEGNPMADKRVRQALNYAVDVNGITEAFFGGLTQRAFTLVAPESVSPNIEPWPYDPDKAKELLAEAGYPDGFEVTLDTPVGRYTKDEDVALAVADYLTRVGVVTTVKPVEWTTYVGEMLMARQTDALFLIGWGTNHDQVVDIGSLSFNFPFNPTEWNNPEFESLLQQAATTMDDEQRQELLYQAQEIAYDESPWIWMYFGYDNYGVSNRLNWTPRPDTRVFLHGATLNP